MSKPTSRIIAATINHVMSDARIAESIARRDDDNLTSGMEIRGRFYRSNSSDPRKAKYIVDFIYAAQVPEDQNNDDISVLVEVISDATLSFRILEVRYL